MPSHSILNKTWPPKCNLQSPVGSLLPSPLPHMPCPPCHLLSVAVKAPPGTRKHMGLSWVVAFALAGFPAWILQSQLLFILHPIFSILASLTGPPFKAAFLPSSNVILWQNIPFFISFIVTKGFCNSFACSLIWILHKNGSFQRQELCLLVSTVWDRDCNLMGFNKYLLNEWTSNQRAQTEAFI